MANLFFTVSLLGNLKDTCMKPQYFYQLLGLVLLLTVHSVKGQNFQKAPTSKKSVNKIIEWVQMPANTEAKKGFEYEFRKDGQLKGYHKDKANNARFFYDAKNRIIKGEKIEEAVESTTTYSYKAGLTTELTHFPGVGYIKILHYLNDKNRVKEEKAYTKNEPGDAKGVWGKDWTTNYRIVYNYNALDSLFGEMYYASTDKNGALKTTSKTIHSFDPKTRKKMKTEYADASGKPYLMDEYQYEKGLLKKIRHKDLKSGRVSTTEYKYKEEQLNQVIEIDGPKKNIRVFKDGRMIRLRGYKDDQLIKIVDYQYVFF